MRQWGIVNDRVIDLGEVDYLGIPYEYLETKDKELLPSIYLGWPTPSIVEIPQGYKGWFPFLRFCYSIGDLGLISGIFEALKTKYPNIQIAFPSKKYLREVLGEKTLSRWSYSTKSTWETNIDNVLANNPYIDYYFNIGDFNKIFTDHDRAYTGLIFDGETVRSWDEPLAEQILRRFGFTDQDINTIDSKPKLYFTDQEIEEGERVLKEHIGDRPYGCLLFASRLERFNKRWDSDKHLFKEAERFKGTPCFYYSTFNIEDVGWKEIFPNLISFSELNIPIRIQMYLKHKAEFNLGYQAGITDACSGGNSEIITLCPYPTIRENCIRGVKYIFSDGTTKTF